MSNWVSNIILDAFHETVPLKTLVDSLSLLVAKLSWDQILALKNNWYRLLRCVLICPFESKRIFFLFTIVTLSWPRKFESSFKSIPILIENPDNGKFHYILHSYLTRCSKSCHKLYRLSLWRQCYWRILLVLYLSIETRRINMFLNQSLL